LHKLEAQFFFVRRGQLGVAGDMNDAIAQDDAVGSYHFSDGQSRGDLNYRDAGFFQFGRDRSAAARARPSSRRQDYGIDAFLLYFFNHLPPQPPRI
jgi:hypothetical protein